MALIGAAEAFDRLCDRIHASETLGDIDAACDLWLTYRRSDPAIATSQLGCGNSFVPCPTPRLVSPSPHTKCSTLLFGGRVAGGKGN